MAYRPKDTQERILHRLKITKGHLEKIIKMVEGDNYCIDVIHQMQAVEAAIRETEGVLLENHLKTCTADAIRNGRKEEAVAEVMNVFAKSK
jgi:DNA-binding FrmR family transcriptional regulator